ncbi:glycosyl hydrolase family 65 protein [Mesomycoplasma neurolyticum]|uniref:Maltose phosphorylase domain-containing protein n=1 Tax=Mesomycoplasma neurolyticum TaxID=2120 RepID=A0A449A5A7_9BACT|nr:glycosyl hydrolase family 65 protein [Mesomycoplasma neurolyticum]VEU59412.1 maltose phosphorylase domain-containing protein [Mesomycoplasma neurolyticum]
MTKLFYDTKKLKIYQKGYDSLTCAKTESIFAQGNGFLGIRAVDEEKSYFHKEDFFINGFFNKSDESEVSELANLANLIQLNIIIDNKLVKTSEAKFYYKELDLTNGKLTRKIKIQHKSKIFEFLFERLVDQKNKQLYAQKITIQQTKGLPSLLKIYPIIDGQSTNRGIQHLNEGKKILVKPSLIQYHEKTNEKHFWAIHNMKINAYYDDKLLKSDNDDYVIKMARRQIGYEIQTKIETNKKFVLEKIMSVTSSIENENCNYEQLQVIANNAANKINYLNFEYFEKKSFNDFEEIYDNFPLKIKGNKAAKYDFLAFKFSIFHLNSFVPNNPKLSIGAKGLTGEGYQGHCYWDTEFFIIPNYVFTNPQIAKNLLEYRYLGIEGARKKAQEKNYLGAQYPWEMALPEDGEVTPYWGQPNIITGEQIPIASREQEIHVSGDVAFAVDHYFLATNDEKFMEQMGYEMIFDTAVFWLSRLEFKNNVYQITNVMGPNEYKGNIDNNNFTNLIAKRNLELAIKYWKKLSNSEKTHNILKKVLNKIPYFVDFQKMEKIVDKIYLQKPNNQLIIAENDQFLKLNKVDVRPFQFLGDAGKKLFNTKEGHKRLESQLVKQADVVLSTFVFKELFNKEIIEANFNYYEPLTTHDSSLSPTTYAITAIDLRKMDLAYKLFKYSIDIDLGTNFHSSTQGIHAGSLAAIWQTIVYGYGGFRFFNDEIHFSPILPNNWTKLSYSIIIKKINITVNVYKKYFEIIKNSSNNLEVFVNNKKTLISKHKERFLIKNV